MTNVFHHKRWAIAALIVATIYGVVLRIWPLEVNPLTPLPLRQPLGEQILFYMHDAAIRLPPPSITVILLLAGAIVILGSLIMPSAQSRRVLRTTGYTAWLTGWVPMFGVMAAGALLGTTLHWVMRGFGKDTDAYDPYGPNNPQEWHDLWRHILRPTDREYRRMVIWALAIFWGFLVLLVAAIIAGGPIFKTDIPSLWHDTRNDQWAITVAIYAALWPIFLIGFWQLIKSDDASQAGDKLPPLQPLSSESRPQP